MSEDIDAVLDKLKAVFDVTSDTALSKAIDVPKTTLSTWRQRNSTPYALCVQIASEK